MSPPPKHFRKQQLEKYEKEMEQQANEAKSSKEAKVPNRIEEALASLETKTGTVRTLKWLAMNRVIDPGLRHKTAYFSELRQEEFAQNTNFSELNDFASDLPETYQPMVQIKESRPAPTGATFGSVAPNFQNDDPSLYAAEPLDTAALPTPSNETTPAAEDNLNQPIAENFGPTLSASEIFAGMAFTENNDTTSTTPTISNNQQPITSANATEELSSPSPEYDDNQLTPEAQELLASVDEMDAETEAKPSAEPTSDEQIEKILQTQDKLMNMFKTLKTLTKSEEIDIQEYPYISPLNPTEVVIGPNYTTVPIDKLNCINWDLSVSIIVRKLLLAVFDPYTLGTSNLSGKPSPAFRDIDKPEKRPLDPDVVADIIFFMKTQCGASEKEVRWTITNKCAGQARALRRRKLKQFKSHTNKMGNLKTS